MDHRQGQGEGEGQKDLGEDGPVPHPLRGPQPGEELIPGLVIGGLGEAVCGLLGEKLPTPVRRVGVQDTFGCSGPAAKVLELSDRIVAENELTTMMVTHNMKDAIVHGNRLIMMYDGNIVIDVSGEEKKKLTVPDLLDLFSKVSGSDEADDKMLLS